MPLVQLSDDAGNIIEVMQVDGYYYPAFEVPDFEKEMRSMKHWKARDDDVLFCAYPKSGTHWIWELAYMMTHNQDKITPAIKDIAMMENLHQERFDAIPSPRVLNSHLLWNQLPKDFFDRRCKLVMVFRNPKDVAVSFYNHHFSLNALYKYNGSWENYIPRFVEGKVDSGSWFEYCRDWEKFLNDNPDYPVHIMYYEDMIEDSLGELNKLAAFMGVKREDAYIDKINNLCKFDNLRQEKNKLENPDHWRDAKPSMYRKGKVGDWKNWFTVSQNEQFDNTINLKMKDSKIKMRFEVDS